MLSEKAGFGFLLIDDPFQPLQDLVVRFLLKGEIQILREAEQDLAAAIFLIVQGLVRLQDGQIPGQAAVVQRSAADCAGTSGSASFCFV